MYINASSRPITKAKWVIKFYCCGHQIILDTKCITDFKMEKPHFECLY